MIGFLDDFYIYVQYQLIVRLQDAVFCKGIGVSYGIFLKAFVYSKGRLTGYDNVMNNLLLNILAPVQWVGWKSD